MSRLADRYAIIFLAVTVALAGIAWASPADPMRAVAVLVVATPCPLILAVPVAIVSGLSRAARLGILIKGGKAIEALARVRALVIDKTGTLTLGQARLVETRVADDDRAGRAVAARRLARPGLQAHHRPDHRGRSPRQGATLAIPSEVVETPGEGIAGQVEGHAVMVGGPHFVAAQVADGGLRGAAARAAARRGRGGGGDRRQARPAS